MFSKKSLGIIILSIVPLITLAAGTVLENPLKQQDLPSLINSVLDVVIMLGTPIVALVIVYAGFLFVTSGGDPKKLDTAKTMFTWTIIGAALILGAKAVFAILQGTVESIVR